MKIDFDNMTEEDEEYMEDIFAYLDELRASGVTNMFGAVPYLIEQFDMTRNEASKWLQAWMEYC